MKTTEAFLSSIWNFPIPSNITGIRDWFGLVEQVAYALSKANVMLPFRDLLKSKAPFKWTQVLQLAFEEARETIAQSVKVGNKTFDTQKLTCMTTDWSKSGLAFALMQRPASVKRLSLGAARRAGSCA